MWSIKLPSNNPFVWTKLDFLTILASVCVSVWVCLWVCMRNLEQRAYVTCLLLQGSGGFVNRWHFKEWFPEIRKPSCIEFLCPPNATQRNLLGFLCGRRGLSTCPCVLVAHLHNPHAQAQYLGLSLVPVRGGYSWQCQCVTLLCFVYICFHF